MGKWGVRITRKPVNMGFSLVMRPVKNQEKHVLSISIHIRRAKSSKIHAKWIERCIQRRLFMVCTDVKRRRAVARPCTDICKILACTWSLNRPPIGKKQHLYWTDWLQRRWTSRLMAPWCSFCHQYTARHGAVFPILISGIRCSYSLWYNHSL